jgi:hypothetical protein
MRQTYYERDCIRAGARQEERDNFIANISNMLIDGETNALTGEVYVQENDDAVDTLGCLIAAARKLVK